MFFSVKWNFQDKNSTVDFIANEEGNITGFIFSITTQLYNYNSSLYEFRIASLHLWELYKNWTGYELLLSNAVLEGPNEIKI